jgi:hypothetical protein
MSKQCSPETTVIRIQCETLDLVRKVSDETGLSIVLCLREAAQRLAEAHSE